MRGVHPFYPLRQDGIQGSSPHARGPLFEINKAIERCGIIPACAGSTEFLNAIIDRV